MPPGKHRLRWAPEAKQDLREIWHYYSEIASRNVADALLRKLKTAADKAADRPLLWRRRDAPIPGLRAVIVHPYAVFYRLTDRGVEIVRVLHERRDFTAELEKRRGR